MVYRPSEYITPSFDQVKDNKYKKFVREITGNPENLRPQPFEEKLRAFYPAREITTPASVNSLPDLLKTNFIVGENHCDRAPKNFLIQNMAKLKEAGYTTLFLEHWYYDDQLEMDDYDPASLSKSEVNQRIEGRLTTLDTGFGILSDRTQNHDNGCRCQTCHYLAGNNFLELVKAAKQCGIRVVGIDTEYTYSEQYDKEHMEYAYGGPTAITQDSFRLKSMNYTATKIIENEMKERPGKWFALIGYCHCYSSEDFSGVPQLTGAKTVLVESEKSLEQVKIEFNGINCIRERKTFWKYNNEMRIINIPYQVKIEAPENHSLPVIEEVVQVKSQETQPEVTIEKKEEREKLVQEFQKRCETQIKRLDSLPKIFNNPYAMEKKRILESAKEVLDNEELSFSDRFSTFREFIDNNRATLTKPHSTIPKDIMKGLLVFVASLFFIVPGVFLGVRFFSPNRMTTTEEQIVKPLSQLAG
ncbi:hypothetical protein EP47_14245 [Legionella norrlandica]|uniref:Haem-binding uptake Tiki superfamily ChaN domain-containing protein n=1 Tax=Legionella norrlandica TaxID=1498499 RepID=A0A0A2T5Y3_9GAMM|nr:membrane-targeted effector domain-containing toxin [Legionella norrlandica]KGP62838.1 hypothetical protein EP47_14245 [Legionella norrlandica]